MDYNELEIERKEKIQYLNAILNSYRSTERKSKKLLVGIIAFCGVAIYFLFSDLFGGTWGYILTIAILAVGVYCVAKLGISFKNAPVSDGKLAYQACVTMEILIAIEKGTYRQYGVDILCTGQGKHLDLYKQFIQLYHDLASKDLEKLASIEVQLKDMQ